MDLSDVMCDVETLDTEVSVLKGKLFDANISIRDEMYVNMLNMIEVPNISGAKILNKRIENFYKLINMEYALRPYSELINDDDWIDDTKQSIYTQWLNYRTEYTTMFEYIRKFGEDYGSALERIEDFKHKK